MTNLGEGAALVILVLLLLLGDIRAGLIVAATIPLAMLFAISLMSWTGASGNLMSLGAIDFGLIVDGAVIIVENAVRRLGEARAARQDDLPPEERLAIVQDAAVEVRSASVFGEAIIAIVYLPILTLRGIEGKLFHPMARTVLFALLGAFILSLTVVPVLASYFLHGRPARNETWIMHQARLGYAPLLRRVLARPSITLGVGLVVLALGGGLLTRLGAEFVPQLDEGDLLLEARRLPGIALSETVATDLRVERALSGLPEVEHVVARAGAPEVATDPMGVEQSDIYIILKPRAEWRSGLTKAQLGEEIAEIVEREVPEMAASVSQPIQMRTNELIAGVRSDVAAQIYGPDLATLQAVGQRVSAALKGIEGVADLRAEQTAGLTYLRVRPDRARLARYGLTIEDVNIVTEAMVVGRKAGEVFEKDRRFDLVVRTAVDYQGSLDVVRALPLKSTLGQIVPLGDVADVALEPGPALVNRDKQSRRFIVEFNVRGRDVISTVEDAQAAVAARVQLPTGYRIEWGGQFQQLHRGPRPAGRRRPARARLDRVPALVGVRQGEARGARLREHPVRRGGRHPRPLAPRHPLQHLGRRRVHRALRRRRPERPRAGVVLSATAGTRNAAPGSDCPGRRAAPASGADDRAGRGARLHPDGPVSRAR